MRSSELRRLGALLGLLSLGCPSAAAARDAQGFAVERFSPSAPGAGWLVMDSLDMRGGLGGAMALTFGDARNPLRVPTADGSRPLSTVSSQSFADFGFAATLDRFRLYLDFAMPLVVRGSSGTVGDTRFTAPAVDLGSHPDTLSDARLGVDARFVGAPDGAFRLGVGAQVFVPNGTRADYDTDHTYRAMARLLVAGDVGSFTYAGHGGVHLRPLDDGATPGSPQGSELLFGAAGGVKAMLCEACGFAFVVGPELYGATALKAAFGGTTTALEALFSARLEGTASDSAALRLKLGLGGGINPHFGAPEARSLLSVEVFQRGGQGAGAGAGP